MKVVERIVIAIFCSISVAAFCAVVNAVFDAQRWEPLSASDSGTWVGAVGTVGAFVGTIWLSLEGERKNRRHKIDLARLAGRDSGSGHQQLLSRHSGHPQPLR